MPDHALDTRSLPPALAAVEFEALIVGTCLQDPAALAAVRRLVAAQAFADPVLAEVYAVLVALDEAEQPTDPVAVTALLRERGSYDRVGGHETVAGLLEHWEPPHHLPHHAQLVAAAASRRALVALAQRLAQDATDPKRDPVALAQALSGELLPHATDTQGGGFRPASERLWAVMEDIEQRAVTAKAGRVPGLPTGYPELDDLFGGWRPGEFVIVGAGPKMGKSTLSLGILANIVDRGQHAGIVSAEMTRDEIVEGLIAQRAGVDRVRLARGRVHDDEWPRLAREASLLKPVLDRLHVDDEAFPSLDDVIARAQQLKIERPEIAFLVVDYLQLITKQMPGRRGDEEIGAVCRGLKGLAKRLGVPVLAPAQVNYKDTDRRTDQRPTLRDLQGGSGMAQTANHILLLYRPGAYETPDPFGHGTRDDVLEVEVAASRRTPKAQVKLGWDGARMRVFSPRTLQDTRARAA